MIYAYRLKDRNSEETGRVVEGFTIRHTWQFTSDPKAVALKNWAKVLVLEAADIASLKKEVDTYDKTQKNTVAEPNQAANALGSQEPKSDLPASGGDDPLSAELEGKSLAELKDYAKDHGFDEAEYSKLARSKLVEYIVLGMHEKENA